ncbi:hypothetical protein, partial [Staphylococcus aureus]
LTQPDLRKTRLRIAFGRQSQRQQSWSDEVSVDALESAALAIRFGRKPAPLPRGLSGHSDEIVHHGR